MLSDPNQHNAHFVRQLEGWARSQGTEPGSGDWGRGSGVGSIGLVTQENCLTQPRLDAHVCYTWRKLSIVTNRVSIVWLDTFSQ